MEPRTLWLRRRYFNPRSRTGSDFCVYVSAKMSTHFNPRSRTGSDLRPPIFSNLYGTFQPTLPHRERHSHSLPSRIPFLFQPTLPHRERRRAWAVASASTVISTHAPAQGATQPFGPASRLSAFQPTLPHRERPAAAAGSVPVPFDFNPRSRTGSDDIVEIVVGVEVVISTHAPAQGATKSFRFPRRPPEFQPTLPHRERPDDVAVDGDG